MGPGALERGTQNSFTQNYLSVLLSQLLEYLPIVKHFYQLERAPGSIWCCYGQNLNILTWEIDKYPWTVTSSGNLSVLVAHRKNRLQGSGTHVERCLFMCLAGGYFFLSCPDQPQIFTVFSLKLSLRSRFPYRLFQMNKSPNPIVLNLYS